MKILSVDTALGLLSACVYCSDSKQILSTKTLEEYSTQAEKLFDTVNTCLEESDITYDDIDIFSATIGPGSFTGIRIGMSAMQGLAFAKDKPFAGVTSLEALKEKAKEEDVSCAINAGRGQVYLQNFPNGEAIAVDLEDIEKNLSAKLICNCFEEIKDYIDDDGFLLKENVSYDAADIAKVAAKLKNEGLEKRTAPVYIRPPDAKKSNIKRKVVFET